MRGVGVVRGPVHICSNDVRIKLLVMLCKSICRRLRRCRLKVVEVAVLLLIVGESLTHVIEDFSRELLCLLVCQVCAQPLRVEADLVHADQADGREVVVEGSQISLCVRIETLLKKLRDDCSLCLEASSGDIHQVVKALVEVLLILCEVSDPRHVDRDDADGTCGLAGAEEAAGLLSQLAEVKAKSAAHRADVAGLHIGVDVI